MKYLLPVFAVAFAFPQLAASAEDVKTTKKVEDMNRAAMEDYDLLEFESAKKQLNDALALAKKAKLDKAAVAARTHLNLGIVYGGGLNDKDTATLEFMSAIEIDASVKLDAAYKTPALQKIFDGARTSVASNTGKDKPVGKTTPETPPVAT
jgi:hypothetical protein